MRVALIGFRDAGFEGELQERGVTPEPGRPRPGLDVLFYMVREPADLLSLRELSGFIHDAGALWVLRVKGPGLKVRDVDVIEAGKHAGLVDNKIASYSDLNAAMRLVVPLARRGSREEAC